MVDEEDKGTSPDEEQEEDAPQASPSEPAPSEESEDSDEDDGEEIDWKAKFEKEKERGDNLKIRAEKAEGKKGKKAPEQSESEAQPTYSLKDTLALQNNKVHEDDVDDVVEYAKMKKISIAEALKSDIIKTTLAKRNEERTTADTTNTNRNRGGRAARTGESLLKTAQTKGEIPENKDELDKMLDARYEKMAKPNG